MTHEGGLGQIARESVSREAPDEDLFGGVGHEKRPSGIRMGIVARLGLDRHEKGANWLVTSTIAC